MMYPDMNIILCSKLFLILITQAVHGSEQIQHINEGSSTYACKGCDKNMHWNDCEEENIISEREWYFNNKTIICSYSAEVSKVSSDYKGRIVMIRKTGFRLINVTLDDEGTYTMLSQQSLSTLQTRKDIFLRVLEPPTENCTLNWGQLPDFKYCGRPNVAFVCKEKQTYEVLKEIQIMNSTLQKKEILCCLDGEAMKCVADSRHFCKTVSSPNQDDKRSSEDGKTQTTGSVTVPVFRDKDHGLNGSQQFRPIDLVILALLIIILIIILVMGFCLVFIIYCKERKKKMDADTKLQPEEAIPLKQAMNDSDIAFELQRLLNITLYPRHNTGEAGPMPKPQNNSETAIEVQNQQKTIPNPKPEKTEMHSAYQQPLFVNYEKVTATDFFCVICFVKKRVVLFLPCAHILTCDKCSSDCTQCPVCTTVIERKMNMCFDIT